MIGKSIKKHKFNRDGELVSDSKSINKINKTPTGYKKNPNYENKRKVMSHHGLPKKELHNARGVNKKLRERFNIDTGEKSKLKSNNRIHNLQSRPAFLKDTNSSNETTKAILLKMIDNISTNEKRMKQLNIRK